MICVSKGKFSFVLRDSLVFFVFLLSLKVLVGLSFDYLVLTIWFSFSVIWVLLGKWTFVFFQVLFFFCCEHWKSNLLIFRAFEVLKKTVGNDLLMHDYLYWFLKEIENCIYINSDCIWFGNRPLSPIDRIHWIKRLHFFISLHFLGQSHTTWVSLPLPVSKQQPFKNFAY